MKLKLIMFSRNHQNNLINNFDDKHLEGNANDSLYILYIDLIDLTQTNVKNCIKGDGRSKLQINI